MKILIRALLSILIAMCLWGFVVFIDEDKPLPPITAEDRETAAKQPALAKEGIPRDQRGTGSYHQTHNHPHGHYTEGNPALK